MLRRHVFRISCVYADLSVLVCKKFQFYVHKINFQWWDVYFFSLPLYFNIGGRIRYDHFIIIFFLYLCCVNQQITNILDPFNGFIEFANNFSLFHLVFKENASHYRIQQFRNTLQKQSSSKIVEVFFFIFFKRRAKWCLCCLFNVQLANFLRPNLRVALFATPRFASTF